MTCSYGWKKHSTLIALVAFMAFGAGCDVEVEGEEGNFSFSYINSKMTNAEDLAEGARVDVRATHVDSEQAVEFTEVFTEDVDTLDVVDQDDYSFTLEAKGEGTVRVTAEGRVASGDEELSDSFEVRSAAVASVEVENRCSSGLFLADAAGRMRYRMFDSQGGQLTGYGHYPVSIEAGEDLLPLELEYTGEINEDYDVLGSLEFFIASEPGTYEVVSDLNGESAEFEVIAASDVDELKPFSGDEATGSVDVGDVERMAALFTVESQEEQVCGALGDVLEVTTDTPQICEAEYFMPFEELGALALHSLEVKGLEAGTCEITVSLSGTERSLDVTVDVN